jgi:hypothetical protein
LPLFIFTDGTWLNLDDIDEITQGANFVIGCAMAKAKPNCGWETDGMTPAQFLNLIGPFSLVAYIEGKNVSNLHFSIEQLESIIAKAENGPDREPIIIKRDR